MNPTHRPISKSRHLQRAASPAVECPSQTHSHPARAACPFAICKERQANVTHNASDAAEIHCSDDVVATTRRERNALSFNRFSAPTLSAIRRPNMDVDYAWTARAHTLIGVHSLLSQHHLEVVQLPCMCALANSQQNTRSGSAHRMRQPRPLCELLHHHAPHPPLKTMASPGRVSSRLNESASQTLIIAIAHQARAPAAHRPTEGVPSPLPP